MVAEIYDYVVIGSGFGGSVSAMRLAEKGYKVLVLERGKRFADHDFPKTNWNIFKFLWLPLVRCFGIQQISYMNDIMVLHGSGVGGGSLVYANVLMEPHESLFESPAWRDLADWKQELKPHYQTAKRMLGVAPNPFLTPADLALKKMAEESGREHTFKMANVGIYFGENGKTVPDPYFDGEGPARTGCTACGGCMVGCRYGAKNTLVKNYLFFAEKWGAEVRPESEAIDIQPLENQSDGARYEVIYRKSTAPFWDRRRYRIRAKNVIVSAHAMGTLRLLLRCRDETKTLPRISQTLGTNVRTNSEALTGSTSWDQNTDFSTGPAITSIYAPDGVTHIEPVRYPHGSSFMRLLAIPIVEGGNHPLERLLRTILQTLIRPIDFLYIRFSRQWARRSTILLIMQTAESTMRVKLGRNFFTLFRKSLVSDLPDGTMITPELKMSHGLTRQFAKETKGIPQDTIPQALLGIPATAHLLGGCPMGKDDTTGVVNKEMEVFNYPGLFVIDGSIVPANPGINPSLTITALAEYAMSKIPKKASLINEQEKVMAQP